MSDAVARVLDLFRQSARLNVTGVAHVTKSNATPKTSMVTPVTPVTYQCRRSTAGYVTERVEAALDADEVNERTAIAIHEGGVPEVYAEAFAHLQTAQPIGIDHSRWLQAVDDAGRFLDQWGTEAERLQWTADDLFMKPVMMRAAIGNCGLCWVIGGRDVVLIKASSVTLSDGLVFGKPTTNVSAGNEANKQKVAMPRGSKHQCDDLRTTNRKAKTMTKAKRFFVNGDREIIDTLNPAKFTFVKGYSRQDYPILSMI
jgi:hypothetical protein